MVFAWTIAEIAVMGAEGAVNIAFKRKIKAAVDPQCLPHNNGYLRNRRFRICIQYLCPMPDNPAMFLLCSRQKCRHIHQCYKGDIKTIAKRKRSDRVYRGYGKLFWSPEGICNECGDWMGAHGRGGNWLRGKPAGKHGRFSGLSCFW